MTMVIVKCSMKNGLIALLLIQARLATVIVIFLTKMIPITKVRNRRLDLPFFHNLIINDTDSYRDK